MSIVLSRLPDNKWKVTLGSVELNPFDTIELASAWLSANGTGHHQDDDEIDLALIAMYGYGHTEATFNNGKFIESRP